MIGIMVSVTIVKFLLVAYCRRFKNEIIRAYGQDHCFDVITNSIGLGAAVLAIRYYWWIDPTGAVIVSSYASLRAPPTPPPSSLFYYTFDNWDHLLFLFIQK